MAYCPLDNLNIQNREKLPVLEFYKRFKNDLKLTIHAGETSENSCILEVGLHRPGLALTGYTSVYSSHQIQIIGHTEWNYLESIGPGARRDAFNKLSSFNAPMWVVTHGQKPHQELVDMCSAKNIPLFSSPLYTFEFIFKTRAILEKYFAPYTKIHGSLVDVFGVGMLYIGDSNVGKSECVLDLVERGHRLVADDAVEIMQLGNTLIGMPDALIGHCMEIRGIGIIDIRSMFGIHAVRKIKKIEVLVELQMWNQTGGCSCATDRTGLLNETESIMGVQVPHIVIPVTPGKNLTVISEVIAMNTLMKSAGENSSQAFNQRLLERIQKKASGENWDVFLDMDLTPYE